MAVLAAVTVEVRAVDRVAVEYGLSWPTVARLLAAAAKVLAAGPVRLTRALGIDEHRFRSVRWFRDDSGSWRRIEPWSVLFTDLDTGAVLGRRGRPRRRGRAWLAEYSAQLVEAPGPGGGDRPVGGVPGRPAPAAAQRQTSVDHFHLVKLANDAVTAVRRRCAWEYRDRRGRAVDPAWAHRLLLLRGADTLSARGWAKLKYILDVDDPSNEIGAAWGIK